MRTDVGEEELLWAQADRLDAAVEQPHVRDVSFRACLPALAHEAAVVEAPLA